jgi:hypothetical protein
MTKKPWAKPVLQKKPYQETIAMLREALQQAERDLSRHPNDSETIQIRNSLRSMVADFESNAA